MAPMVSGPSSSAASASIRSSEARILAFWRSIQASLRPPSWRSVSS